MTFTEPESSICEKSNSQNKVRETGKMEFVIE